MASREALQKLIQFGNAEQFATHAEDWSACSSAAILNAAVEKLGKLTQQRAYKDNVGTTDDLAECPRPRESTSHKPDLLIAS